MSDSRTLCEKFLFAWLPWAGLPRPTSIPSHRRRHLAFTLRSLTAIITVCLGSMVSGASAQTSGQAREAASTFEVASVKPAQPDSPYRSDNDLFSEEAWIGNGLRANANFQAYVLFAYHITDTVQARAIWDRLPLWARLDKYEIQATAFPGVSRQQVRGMMQALLTERFALRTHKETKQEDAFVLSLRHAGITGPRLRPHPASQTCLSDPNRAEEISAPENDEPATRYCGVTTWKVGDQRHLQIVNATMAQIAEALASESLNGGYPTPHVGTEVSGLVGTYDMDLQYVPSDRADDVGGTTFQEALRKQAGLILVERKQPVELIVIDHLERPTSN